MSELLSKPKSWDKLTEKGRDSYRYVLGLSQGIMSELLSKPKSWDKPTEKGQDSYR